MTVLRELSASWFSSQEALGAAAQRLHFGVLLAMMVKWQQSMVA
jgi:hypothetical protein